MKKASITPRIYYSTYLRFRKSFKATRGETMASYFERLSRHLESIQIKPINFIPKLIPLRLGRKLIKQQFIVRLENIGIKY